MNVSLIISNTEIYRKGSQRCKVISIWVYLMDIVNSVSCLFSLGTRLVYSS